MSEPHEAEGGQQSDEHPESPPLPAGARAEQEALLSQSKELEKSETDVEPTPSTANLGDASNREFPGVGLLLALLGASVFCDLFHSLAYNRYNLGTNQARVAAMAHEHPFFYRVCRWLDLATRLLLELVMVAAIALIAWGVIRRTFFTDGFGIPSTPTPTSSAP